MFKVLYISSKEHIYFKKESLEKVCSGPEVVKLLCICDPCIQNTISFCGLY